MPQTIRTRISLAFAAAALAACATAPTPPAEPREPTPREGLSAGIFDAGEAAWNLKLVHAVKPPPGFFDPDRLFAPAVERQLAQDMADGKPVRRPPTGINFANTDLAFSGDRVIVGNFHGFNVYNAAAQGGPEAILSVVCPGGQGDVSVHGNLVFFSTEQNRGRLDCGAGGVADASSSERFLGVRIFDISNLSAPRQVAAIQTCRGSHTHTLVPHPTDANILYVYNQGTSGVRPETELAGCSGGEPGENPDTAFYSIDIIEVPLDAPQNAAIVSKPRIFADRETGEINGLWRGGNSGPDTQRTSATNHCHDITVYPEMNLAAGACSGNGILLDISDRTNPQRIDEIFDSNMAYWHSAVFNNDADKVLYSDEWGGGLGARCRATDRKEWGANIVVDLTNDGMVPRAYYKIPTVQTEAENCVSHNGNLIPVPGRDILVQGWYSGGVSVIDFTDSANPFEIAYFDRGPIDASELYLGGYWAAYWHNGRIYAPEIIRGLDVFELLPSDHLSAAEIAAASAVRFDEANTQVQEKFVWTDSPVVAEAYLDQLIRSDALSADLATETANAIRQWQRGRVKDGAFADLATSLAVLSDATTDRPTARRLGELAEALARAK